KGGKPKAAAAATPIAPKRKSAEPVTKLPVTPRTRKPATRAEKAPAETPAKVRARK
ncbi:Ku protein, partial [Paraburkholderia hospita]